MQHESDANWCNTKAKVKYMLTLVHEKSLKNLNLRGKSYIHKKDKKKLLTFE